MSYASDVAAANDALVKAQADLATAQSTAQSAAASVTAAEAAVAQAQAALDVAVRNAQTANSAVTSAQNFVTQAQSHLDYLLANPPVTPPSTRGTIIGYSTKASWWNAEMAKLGASAAQINARRIFCDLGKGASDQKAIIDQAIAAGQVPQLSYKVPNVAAAISGSMDATARACGQFLASYNVDIDFVVWHEPNGDMTPADFVRLNKRLAPLIKSSRVRYGQYINGFLVINQLATFNAFVPDDLLAISDWTGIDAYHAGSMTNPDPVNTPGKRIRTWLSVMQSRGVKIPLQIGEYNGFSAAAILDAGKAILDNPQITKACMWSSETSTQDFRLTGSRLDAFKATLADPRVKQ